MSFNMIHAYLRKKELQVNSASNESPRVSEAPALLCVFIEAMIKFPVVLFRVVIHRSRASEPNQEHLSMLQTVLALPWKYLNVLITGQIKIPLFPGSFSQDFPFAS